MNDAGKPEIGEHAETKKPYTRPQLIEHGKVADITATNGSDPEEPI